MNLAHDVKAPNGKPLVDAVYTAHPSNLSIPGEFEKVVRPTALGIGDEDIVMGMKSVNQVKDIWAKKPDVETEVKIYPGAGHGFAVRADPNTKDAVRQAGEAEEQAVAWFKKQFAKVSY